MKIEFKVDCEFEVVDYYDEDEDVVDSSMERFKTGDTFDNVFVIERHEENNTVDIQFSDGAVAFGLNCDWFEEIADEQGEPLDK